MDQSLGVHINCGLLTASMISQTVQKEKEKETTHMNASLYSFILHVILRIYFHLSILNHSPVNFLYNSFMGFPTQPPLQFQPRKLTLFSI